MADLRVSRVEERLAVSNGLAERISIIARLPTAVTWNRLEGRPRTDDLARPLRAEVRDPLWMLARQWQLGEFAGADSGMPVRAKLLAYVNRVADVALRDQPPRPYDGMHALEATVERQPVEPDLLMSLHLGRQWLSAITVIVGAADPLLAAFQIAYAIPLPVPGGRDLAALQLTTYRKELRLRQALAGKSVDGAAVLADIDAAERGGRSLADAFVDRGIILPAAVSADIATAAANYLDRWRNILFTQPAAPTDDAWVPERLEHALSIGIPNGNRTETRLVADQYPGGHLDWYAFDFGSTQKASGDAPPSEKIVKAFVPTPVRFGGMPNVRWWEFEDRRVGFGLTTASKTDLVKLLLGEFGLVFSNDWFILPLSCKVGSMVATAGIVVSDNFGFNTLVEPTAGRHAALGLAGDWGMWTLARRDAPGKVDSRFFLAPALARSLESAPLDEVVFLRDEMANLTWGVEAVIPDAMGGGRDGRDAARLLRDAIARAYPVSVPAGDQASDVLLTYKLMGSVPENWIPMVSVRLQGEASATAFLQGAMPRVPPLEPTVDASNVPILESNVVLPRGGILSRAPHDKPNIIFEEEILRGGSVVRRTVQQARWHDGSTITWVGRKKLNGRGEGSSGLAFDQVTLRRPAS